MRRVSSSVVWLVLAVVVVLGVHVAAHSRAVTPQHDDLVTLQLAAGSLPAWDALTDDPAWRPAGTYQALLERDVPTSPVTIADHVARLDIHPPAHELVISWWLPVAGRSLEMLLAVNLLIAGALAWVAGRLATRSGAAPPLAAAIAVAAAASPGVLMTGQELRPYLLGSLLATMLAAWVVILTTEPEKERLGPWRWAQGAVLVLLLALTSFASVFVVMGAALAVLVTVRGRRRWLALSAFPAGGVAALLVWPQAFDQLTRQEGMQAVALFDQAVHRTGQVVQALASVVWPAAPPVRVGLPVLLALATMAIVAVVRRGRPAGALAILLAVGVAGHTLFHVAGRAPIWAMAPKYVAFVLPALVVVALLALRGTGAAATVLVATGLAVVLTRGAILGVLEPPPPPETEDVDAVMVTNPRRGVALRTLWHLPAHTPATVGARHRLTDLIEATPGCRVLIDHNQQGGGSDVTPEDVNDAFRGDGWELEPAPPPARRSDAWLAVRGDC